MKELLRRLSLLTIVLMLVSCSKDESPKTTEKEPEPTPHSYTIMFYGCGGGNLDNVFEDVALNGVVYLDLPSNINVVGQMKWSYGYGAEATMGKGGVARYTYDHQTNAYKHSIVSDKEYDIDDASNLANFITWTKRNAPADEYIMVFMGHGNGYHPSFEGSNTRATLRDDQDPVYLGLNSITEAFELSDAKFNLIYMHSCLMNSLEYATELAQYTNYYLASTLATSGSGGEIYYILEALMAMDSYNEESIIEAVKHLLDKDYDEWWCQDIFPIDHVLTDCSKIAEINSAIREFTDIVIGLYDEEASIGSEAMMERYGFTTTTIDEALGNAYYLLNAHFSESQINNLEWYRISYAFDIVDIATQVAEATQFSEITAAANKIRSAATETTIYKRYANIEALEQVYYNITLVNSEQWSTLGYEAAGYTTTALDKATGWSRLLRANNGVFQHCR